MAQFAVYRAKESARLENKADQEYKLEVAFDENERTQKFASTLQIGQANAGIAPSDVRVVPAPDDYAYPKEITNGEINEIVREYNHFFTR